MDVTPMGSKDYWKAAFDDAARAHPDDPFVQVAKTENGVAVAASQLQVIVDTVTQSLQLSRDDALADLCCGNGLVTSRLSAKVGKVVAVDQSGEMIAGARRVFSAPNIIYLTADVTRLPPRTIEGYRKLLMYEGLQYLDIADLRRLIDRFCSELKSFILFLGGVPDRDRISDFYRTHEERAFLRQCVADQRPHVGRWWLAEEIAAVASACGCHFSLRPQDSRLYTHHYRFDCIVEKTHR